jgi:hypothetical protein
MIGIGLRNAPRVAVNGWSTFNDPQVLSNAHQFYQRTGRTTARPIQGGAAGQGTAPRPDASAHRNSTPQPEIAPRLDANPQPKTIPHPESATHPTAAQPTTAQPEAAVQPAATQPASGKQPTPAPVPESRPDSNAKEPGEHAVPRR